MTILFYDVKAILCSHLLLTFSARIEIDFAKNVLCVDLIKLFKYRMSNCLTIYQPVFMKT